MRDKDTEISTNFVICSKKKILFRVRYSFKLVYGKSYKTRLIVDNYGQQIRAGRALMSVAGSVRCEYAEADEGGLLPHRSFRFAWGLAAKGTECTGGVPR